MTDVLEFVNVTREDMGALYLGDLKLMPNAISHKNRTTGRVNQYSLDDMESIESSYLANQTALRIATKNGDLLRFSNITDSQMNKIKTYIATKWKRDVGSHEICIKGWNYGETTIVGKNLQFVVNNSTAFEVPLSNVSNCSATKSEAVLEFHNNDDCPVNLVEMRLHIPQIEGAGDDELPSEAFRDQVMQFAGIEAESEQPIVLLTGMPCVTPRGRYDIKVFPTFLSFHGKTYDYKIPSRSVNRLFMLPHKDGRRMYFTMHINPPIRQGQTRYSFIVFEFNKDERGELELSLTEEQIANQYKIEKKLDGPLYQIVAKLFRTFVGIKVTIPGGFKAKDQTESVTCSHKQSHGLLFPMDKGFLYVPKPPMYVRFEEISNVNFARSDVSTKTFDLEISVKNGSSFTFSSVAKDDFEPLRAFCMSKNLPLQNIKNLNKGPTLGTFEDPDPYKARLKSEAAEADSDESDSDEEDDDYDLVADEKRRKQKASDDSEATDGTEPDEEYASESEEDEPEVKKKKKSDGEKEKKEKKEKPSKKESKTSKKDKDPNKPKRGLSAYMIWMQEKRSEISQNGKLGVAEVAKEAGRIWKTLSESDRVPYEEKAKKDKERYDTEMREYKASGAEKAFKKKMSPKKAAPASASQTQKSPSKAKSKEFVSSSDDSSSEEEEKKKKSDKKKDKEKSKKKEPTPVSSSEASSDADDSEESD